jgi:hypothetical protein
LSNKIHLLTTLNINKNQEKLYKVIAKINPVVSKINNDLNIKLSSYLIGFKFVFANKNALTGIIITTIYIKNIFDIHNLSEVSLLPRLTWLNTIVNNTPPESLKELAEISGKQPSNLSRTLKTFERYGIIELKKENKLLKPIVKVTNFQIEYKSA